MGVPALAGWGGAAFPAVRLLGGFGLLGVPAAEAERVVSSVSGEQVRGHELRLERVQAEGAPVPG